MIIARQSTARTMMVGPVLDASGVAVTDCVVADFEGSVNGGDPAALNGSATLTHRGVGFYSLALTATDLGTVGQFEVTINDTVNACPMKEITVVEEAVYDALFAASATGMLPANVIQLLGTAWLTPGTAGTPDVNVKLISDDETAANNAESFFDGTGYAGTNNVIPTVTPTTTATNVTTVNGLAAGVITAASIAADAITDAKVASDVTIASVTGAVGSVTGNVGGNVAGSVGSIATGGIAAASFAAGAIDAAAIAADAIGSSELAASAVTEIQSGLATAAALAAAQTSLDDLPTNAELSTALGTADDAVLAAIAALNNLSASGLFTTQMTESYAADGTAPTLAQCLFLIQQSLHEFAISSTTRTVKKLDGTTTAATFTLDDATNPTSTTRAS